MKIRSVTGFTRITQQVEPARIRAMGQLGEQARHAFSRRGYEVQTVRLATQPLNQIIQAKRDLLPFARTLERACSDNGIDFKGLGAIHAANKDADLSLIPGLGQVLGSSENVFAAVQIATRRDGINLRAIRATARLIQKLSTVLPGGLANFRFAALANVSAGAPFFPAAFASSRAPSFSIATEAADLAVDAIRQARNIHDARARLTDAIRREATAITRVARTLARENRMKFNGIDFTPAPDVGQDSSLGMAMERLTGNAFGERTTLFAVAFITDCIRRVKFPRVGFSGAFFPVLEDSVIAARSHTNNYSIDSLLLFSGVCGTGLDNIPLPGDTSVDELAAILLDLATLAVKLDKPLTARLLPIPGAQVGDMTPFDFRWFTNARILPTRGKMTRAWTDANKWIDLK